MIRVAERVLAKGFVFLSRAFGLIQVHLSSDSELQSVVFINKVATFQSLIFRFFFFESGFIRFGFYSLSLALTGFYWVLLGFIRFYWVLLGFIGFYWVFLGFTEFY